MNKFFSAIIKESVNSFYFNFKIFMMFYFCIT